MTRICAWCEAIIRGANPAEAPSEASHALCSECLEMLTHQLHDKGLRLGDEQAQP